MAKINVLAELDKFGIGYQFASGNEVQCKCPFHKDDSPSCSVNTDVGVFICRAAHCAASGDIIDFLARATSVTRKVMTVELSKRYSLSNEPTVKPALIEKYHQNIWMADVLRNELYKRGLTDADIRKHRLGVFNGRITIPIKNDNGEFVNVRSYLPGAPGADKMKNLKGRAKKLRLYPEGQLGFNRLVITGGEMKAIVGSRWLNPFGIGCVTVTGGEGAWAPYLNDKIGGKLLYALMDIDAAGRMAADRILRMIQSHAVSTYDVLLPLDPLVYPKGDVNDYVTIDGNTPETLLALIESCSEWTSEDNARVFGVEPPQQVTLNRAYHAEFTSKRVEVVATVSAVDTKSCAIAKDFTVSCTKDQDFCGNCNVFAAKDERVWSIHPESDSILKMALQADYKQEETMKLEIGVPRECRVIKFSVKAFHNIENVLLSSSLSITDTSKDKELLPAMIVGEDIELNEEYRIIGTSHPHPKDQTTHLVISKYTTSADALSTHKIKDPNSLKIFQPSDWSTEAISERFHAIASDFEANVTHIYGRPELHIITDLAYHSPLVLDMGRDGLQRGWVQVLILGDSAEGKSETVLRIKEHYGLGEKVSCKNASRSGILGGVDQSLGGHFVTWGALPTNDRRLVILEEFKGCSVDLIAQLTDVRDSGIAELQKIKKRRTNARTRIIALTNSRSGNQLAQYPYGVTAIPELVGAAEDIRRFDACLIVEKGELDKAQYNQAPPIRSHVYTSELCRELVLWSWTRNNSVNFTDEAKTAILEITGKLIDKYTDEIPIVDRGSMRYKVSRLAASCAARTFSTDETHEFVIVREGHVKFVTNFIQSCYDKFAFGYDRYSTSRKLSSQLREPDKIRELINAHGNNNFLLETLIENDQIRLVDVMDASGNHDTAWARSFISFLVQRRALINKGSYYVKTAEFVKFINTTTFVTAPSFVEPEF